MKGGEASTSNSRFGGILKGDMALVRNGRKGCMIIYTSLVGWERGHSLLHGPRETDWLIISKCDNMKTKFAESK